MSYSKGFLLQDDQQITDIIGHIYDSACDSHAWKTVLRQVTRMTGSKSALLLEHNQEQKLVTTFSSYGLEKKWLELYASKYGSSDHLLQMMASAPVGEFRPVEAGRFYQTDTYKEFYKPQEICHFAGVQLVKRGVHSVILGLQRSVSAAEYDSKAFSEVKRLVPHLQKALHIRKLYIKEKIRSEVYEAGINSMQTGIVLFNNLSLITYCNKAAVAIIRKHPAIAERDGKIYSSSSECNKSLSEAIRSASQANMQGKYAEPISLGLKCPDTFGYLPVLVMPVQQSGISKNLSNQSATAMMILTDPERELQTTPEQISVIYGLTKAEAEVAICLANAMSAQQVADIKNVKLSTVRSQIQSVFTKMGVTTQAQLVKVILASPLAATR